VVTLEEETALRKQMVTVIAAIASVCADQLGKDKLSDRVMAAMARVPRHQFVPAKLQVLAYEDMPLPIGCGKTISQPFMVALMTDLLELKRGDRVLEVGTGLGYQGAVLAELCDEVFSIELISELAAEAERRLRGAGYGKVQLRIGDGSRGWPEHAPYDKIIVAAAPEQIPSALVDQLKCGGRMVIPAGVAEVQRLLIIEKGENGRVLTKELIPVLFSALISSH
jgi:protein-L-isoaspartate(D-aspartate) O-methyltransferase